MLKELMKKILAAKMEKEIEIEIEKERHERLRVENEMSERKSRIENLFRDPDNLEKNLSDGLLKRKGKKATQAEIDRMTGYSFSYKGDNWPGTPQISGKTAIDAISSSKEEEQGPNQPNKGSIGAQLVPDEQIGNSGLASKPQEPAPNDDSHLTKRPATWPPTRSRSGAGDKVRSQSTGYNNGVDATGNSYAAKPLPALPQSAPDLETRPVTPDIDLDASLLDSSGAQLMPDEQIGDSRLASKPRAAAPSDDFNRTNRPSTWPPTRSRSGAGDKVRSQSTGYNNGHDATGNSYATKPLPALPQSASDLDVRPASPDIDIDASLLDIGNQINQFDNAFTEKMKEARAFLLSKRESAAARRQLRVDRQDDSNSI